MRPLRLGAKIRLQMSQKVDLLDSPWPRSLELKMEFATRQRKNAEVSDLIAYLEKRTLPEDARRLVAESATFEIVDGILFKVQPDKTLRLYVPEGERRRRYTQECLLSINTQPRSMLPCQDTTGGAR